MKTTSTGSSIILIKNILLFPIEKIGGHQTFRTDQCIGAENKQQKKDNIRAIQEAFIREKKIRISFKLLGGGTTNDGEPNTIG